MAHASERVRLASRRARSRLWSRWPPIGTSTRRTRAMRQRRGARTTTTSVSSRASRASSFASTPGSESRGAPSSTVSQRWSRATRAISTHGSGATVNRVSATVARSKPRCSDSPRIVWASRNSGASSSGTSSGVCTTESSRTRPTPGVRTVAATPTRLAALAGLAMGTSTSGLRPRSRARSGSRASAVASATRAPGARSVR